MPTLSPGYRDVYLSEEKESDLHPSTTRLRPTPRPGSRDPGPLGKAREAREAREARGTRSVYLASLVRGSGDRRLEHRTRDLVDPLQGHATSL